MTQNNDKTKKVVPKSWGGSPKKLVNTILNGFAQLEKDIKEKSKS